MQTLENLYDENNKLNSDVRYLKKYYDNFIMCNLLYTFILLFLVSFTLTLTFGIHNIKCLPIECSVTADDDKFNFNNYN
jgi:hypothetical protein